MRTLNISISDSEFNNLGIQKEHLSYTELVELIRRELSRKTLYHSMALAEKVGLSGLTMEDIDAEVKAVRRNAKDNH